MKKPKYLVRSDDYLIFEIDPSNGCYRPLDKNNNINRQQAYDISM